MKARWIALAAASVLAGASAANASLELAQKNGCTACHAIDKKAIAEQIGHA